MKTVTELGTETVLYWSEECFVRVSGNKRSHKLEIDR